MGPLREITRTLLAMLCGTAFVLTASLSPYGRAQQPRPPAESKPAPTLRNAAQIELLETKYRFATNGDSRKEVHTRVRINNEIGARQFAHLNFDFNRDFQSVEIPLVRVTHSSGGTADILPSAITDNPSPAVANYPAYQNVRVKSVRILGLAPGDLLEYRVITTTTGHPLAPDFWLDHSFDRSGIVSQENFEIDLPAILHIEPYVNQETPLTSSSRQGQGDAARVTYIWQRKTSDKSGGSDRSDGNGPDVRLSTFKSWPQLAGRLRALVVPSPEDASAVREKAAAISPGSGAGQAAEIYQFVAQKIKTLDVPLDATGFRCRKPAEILQTGYATAEDKFVLFAALLPPAEAGFVLDSAHGASGSVPSPGRFSYLLAFGSEADPGKWLDLSAEVAPEGMIPAQFRGRPVLIVGHEVKEHLETVTPRPLYKSSQQVTVEAALAPDGVLRATVHYTLRGDNELLLRVAFHQTPKEKWQEVAQMLSLSDGFRGQVTKVTASDPYSTAEPFTVTYEISQPKFADWSKRAVRIPAILPLPGLPDPASAEPDEASKPIELGTPLAIDLESTVELPAGAAAEAPIGTTVNRDYATFSSKYWAAGNILRASRHLDFLLPELPGSRTVDLNAFLHAVQSDQAQFFTIHPAPEK
jgi:hypothetical protein